MKFTDYSEIANRTIRDDLLESDQLINAAMGLSGEAGEVLDAVKKVMFQDHEIDREKIKDELGDVMWYLNLAAKCIGCTLEEVAMHNNAKLIKRYGDSFSAEASINREV